MITSQEISWLAGLLEGEGSFFTRRPRGDRPTRDRRSGGLGPRIFLAMTDRDVVGDAANLLGVRCHGEKARPGRLPVWRCRVHGNVAAAWMMTLYSLMGIRRRQRIAEVLAAWRLIPARSVHARMRLAQSPIEGRVCPRCARLLTFDSFGIDRGSRAARDGRRSRCRECSTRDGQRYRSQQRAQACGGVTATPAVAGGLP